MASDTKPMVSIIVPVYNAAAYLRECLTSIAKQQGPKFEVIMVNDGSTDDSRLICEEWQARDARFRLLTVPNGGAGRARNIGVANAYGTYVTFFDADDAMEADYLQVLWKNLQEHQADMAIVNFYVYNEDQHLFQYYLTDQARQIFTLDGPTATMMQWNFQWNGSLFVVAMGKLAKRELYEQIPFPEGMMYEDDAVTHRQLMACQRVVVVNEEHWLYRVRPASVMTATVNQKRLQDLLRAFEIKMLDLALAGLDVGPCRDWFAVVGQQILEELKPTQRATWSEAQRLERMLNDHARLVASWSTKNE